MARYAYTNTARAEYAERVRPQRTEEPRRSFEVVEGSGLDARVREGVSSSFIHKLKVALAIGAAVLTLGTARIALYAQTVTSLQTSNNLRSEIRSAEALSDELLVERSILCSAERIERIATENYGMIPAEDNATIQVRDMDSSADSSAVDAAESVDDAGADAQAQ